MQWDLQQRYTTLSHYANDTFQRQITKLETEKDSIKADNVELANHSHQSELKYDSILRVYESKVVEALYYYEEY